MVTTKLNSILVPTDFSETASHALRYASGLAAGLGSTLTVLYCDPFLPPIDFTATTGGWDDDSFVELTARAEEQLARDAEANIDPSVPYDVVVRVAAPLDGIMEQARLSGSGLIVMGTHGRKGFSRLMIGSLTEVVMRKAEVPVIAVPPRSGRAASFKTIVCPVVYNARCLQALEFAVRIAPPPARFILIRSAPDGAIDLPAEDLVELSAWLPEPIASRFALKTFRNSHFARQVQDFAKSAHADLIVAAQTSDRSAGDTLHGTFAERLVPHSACPVLTVNDSAATIASRAMHQKYRSDPVWANQASKPCRHANPDLEAFS